MTDTTPHADIRWRHNAYLASPVHKSGFTCCTAHASADDVPTLLAEIHRERETSRRLMEQRQQMAAERFAWQERGDRAEAEVDRLRTELAAARRRSETATGQLLHFAAEAHRRKWAHDNGGEGPTSPAFAALHRLGNEMRAAVDALTPEPNTRTVKP